MDSLLKSSFFATIRNKFTEWLELVSDKTRGVLEYIIKMCNKVLELFEKAKKYVSQCLDTNWISSQGAYIRKFEKDLAKYNKVCVLYVLEV